MAKRRLVASLAVAGGLALAAAASGAVQADQADDKHAEETQLGPNGEVPAVGVTDEDVELYAKTHGLTLGDARFALFDGSRIAYDFTERHRDNPEFGSLMVPKIDGTLSYELRVTTESSVLGSELQGLVGERPVRQFAAGMSAADLARAESEIHESLRRQLPLHVPLQVGTDHSTGEVIVTLNPTPPEASPPTAEGSSTVVELASTIVADRGSVVVDPSLTAEQPASYAGVSREPTCTIGIPLVGDLTGTPALMTSAHCSDTGASAYGFSLGNAIHEQCYGSDRQLHTTAANYLWYGFFNYQNQWTTIHAVAGGWYTDQPWFRRGKNTTATGDVGTVNWGTQGGECAGIDVYGFVLDNDNGGAVVGGDSGGPMFLAYNGKWYFAGITSTEGPSGSDGRVAWRSIPNYWTACTAQDPCGSV